MLQLELTRPAEAVSFSLRLGKIGENSDPNPQQGISNEALLRVPCQLRLPSWSFNRNRWTKVDEDA